MRYHALPLFTREGAPIAYYQPSLFDPDNEPAAPSPTSRPFDSWSDDDLQDLVVLDAHEGHVDPDLKDEFDARVSAAFIGLFESLGAGPDGTRIVLHPGLKRKLKQSTERLDC